MVAIPAGVGHKRLSEKRGGFTVVGGYPPGQSGTITRPGEYPLAEAERLIAALALAERRPAFRRRRAADRGLEGPLAARRPSLDAGATICPLPEGHEAGR